MELEDFFRENPKAALGFSGGVDSTYLLYAALKAGAQVKAYYVDSPFQPRSQLQDARCLAEELGAEFQVLEKDVLTIQKIAENGPERCYFCKMALFSMIADRAREDGYRLVIDGTNASDDQADRPGMRALLELGVRSPLRACGLTKQKIRALSRDAGLSTWDLPANSCLATRIRTGERITAQSLSRAEYAENALRSMGFRDFRVRLYGQAAILQLRDDQLMEAARRRGEVLERLAPYFEKVLLDLQERECEEIN